MNRTDAILGLMDVGWSSIPPLLSGISLILSYRVFRRDRNQIERRQIEQFGIWVDAEAEKEPLWPKLSKLALPQVASLLFHVRNSSTLPLNVDFVGFEVSTQWDVDSANYRGSGYLNPGRFTENSQGWSNAAVAPNETFEYRHRIFILNQAPEGATSLRSVNCAVRWIDITDSAGRRWQIRPGKRKPIRRFHWYQQLSNPRQFPHPWHHPRYDILFFDKHALRRHPIRSIRSLITTKGHQKFAAAPHSAEYDEFRSHTTRQENEQLALTDLIDGKDVT